MASLISSASYINECWFQTPSEIAVNNPRYTLIYLKWITNHNFSVDNFWVSSKFRVRVSYSETLVYLFWVKKKLDINVRKITTWSYRRGRD